MVAKKTSKCFLSNGSTSLRSVPIVLSPTDFSTFANFFRPLNYWMATPRPSTEFSGRPVNCFACGKSAHWRSEYVQILVSQKLVT